MENFKKKAGMIGKQGQEIQAAVAQGRSAQVKVDAKHVVELEKKYKKLSQLIQKTIYWNFCNLKILLFINY